MSKYRKFWWVLTIVFGLDLLTKAWVVSISDELRDSPITIIDGISGRESFFEITYITNPGAAWSMLSDYPEFLTALAGIALLAIFIYRKQLELSSMPQQLIFGAICGGIAGNLTDRLFREPAEVVDFIDIYFPIVGYDYPIFNIADSGIFLGATFYFIWTILDARKEKLDNEFSSSHES
ncbi:signal peptidase II [Opitutales bacterium]|nr:signal peptidase II [Opitutales bacterium]MDA8990721.1 signal peptidase II [Opitutales bacterium]